MAKTIGKSIKKSEVEKEGSLSEQKSDRMSVGKYLQLYGSSIHLYTRAYAEGRFRGIIKSKGSWDEAIKKLMEGDK